MFLKQQSRKLFFIALILSSILFVEPIKVNINQAYFILNNGDAQFTENYILGFGKLEILAALCLKVFQSIVFILPEKPTIFAILNALTPPVGFLVVLLGNMIGYKLCFVCSRFLLADFVKKMVEKMRVKFHFWNQTEQFLKQNAATVCFSLALFAYFPSALFAFLLGGTSLPIPKFLLWFSLGTLPKICLYCFLKPSFSADGFRVCMAILAVFAASLLLFQALRPKEAALKIKKIRIKRRVS